MSTAAAPASTPPVETKEEKKDTGFLGLGIDFNNPLVIGGLIFLGLPLSYYGINFIKNFIFKEQQQQPPVQRQRMPSAEELRRAQYQRDLDVRNRRMQLSQEQEYLENLKRYGVVEHNNNNLKTYNVHKNFKPEPYVEDETEIDILDDNMIDYNNYVFAKDVRKPFTVDRPVVREQQQRKQEQPMVQEDSLLISSDEIDTYTDDEIRNIPPEFVNVGNRPEAFENIQPVDRKPEKEQDDDLYNLDNYEISEDELKKMEAQAMAGNDYY